MTKEISTEEFVCDRRKTVCFTGHRPEKIPFGESAGAKLEDLGGAVYSKIYEAAEHGYDTFLSGMQRGMDLWAAEQVVKLRSLFPNLKLYCISPYRGELNQRKDGDFTEYERVMEQSNGIIYVSEHYHKGAYNMRNQFMVDHSSLLIGAVLDYRSGTGLTIKYARARGIALDIIDLNEFLSPR